jgi:hypothetical protein
MKMAASKVLFQFQNGDIILHTGDISAKTWQWEGVDSLDHSELSSPNKNNCSSGLLNIKLNPLHMCINFSNLRGGGGGRKTDKLL